MRLLRFALAAVCLAACPAGLLASQDRLAAEVVEHHRRVLADAGYEYTEPSMILALEDGNSSVRSSAVLALRRLPASRTGIDALKQTVRHGELILARVAALTLVELRATGWEDDAAARFEQASGLKESVAKLEMAGVLAQAGRSDGWEYVRETIATSTIVSAVAQVARFHGLRDAEGQVIDAVVVLERIKAGIGVSSSRENIRAAAANQLDDLRKRLAEKQKGAR